MTADRRRDLILALALAAVLSIAWAWRAWPDLAQLRLPDTDDVMRLQQVRDWLGGQAFGDVAQHRLGLGGPVHWSRLADLPVAALIVALAPVAGRHAAEVAAVTLWPGVLFAGALFLVARIARALGAPAATAVLVAAVAYPATTVFLPGRIDHHGLQLVLLLGALLAALGPATLARGAVTGACAAASLVVGLETAPLLAVIGAAVVVEWIGDGGLRFPGLGIGALAGLLVGRAVFASDGFFYAACDGFTNQAWRAATLVAGGTLLLSVMPDLFRHPPLVAFNRWVDVTRGGPRHEPVLSAAAGGVEGAGVTKGVRAFLAALILGIALAAALATSPACLHPYGAVDPLLARLWLSQVAEAQSAWSAPLGAAIGYCGVVAAGLVAGVWQWRRARARGWAVLLAVQVAAAALALVQLRGAQSGAMLGAPALAAAIAAARVRGGLALVGAWLSSAGLLYPIAAAALVPGRRAPPPAMAGDCGSTATMATLARLPAATLLAPVDAGAWALGATPHRVLAAPLHRNAAGNLAVYRFYLGSPADAAAIARRWRVTYVLACDGMPGASDPRTAAGALTHGALPGFRPIARSGDGSVIYLSGGARPF